MSSYYSTTLVPPSPSRSVDPHTCPIPDTDELLYIWYIHINNYLDRMWEDYLRYCKMVEIPEASKIFTIIFAEMEFFETINGRIIDKMSSGYLFKMHYHERKL